MSTITSANHRPFRRAYTLAELLVVISIFVLVLAIAVPAFSSLIYSTERSQAENQIGVALGAARSAASSSESMGDTAAVFFYDPGTGRTRIGIYTQVGQMQDVDPADTTKTIARDVFVPLPAYQAIQLPRYWMVRGYAPPGSIDAGTASGANGWYEQIAGRAYDKTTGNWVFPETGFYMTEDAQGRDTTPANTGANRQTFMVRFDAGTGALCTSKRQPALVVDVSPSKAFRSGAIFGASAFRLDTPEDLAGQVRRILASRTDLGSTVKSQQAARQKLLGDESTDTVLARPVAELAFYDERRLASAVGARGLNAVTGCLYGDPAKPRSIPIKPTIDTSLVKTNDVELSRTINEWLQGTGDSTVLSDAKIFTIDRYLGQTREVTP